MLLKINLKISGWLRKGFPLSYEINNLEAQGAANLRATKVQNTVAYQKYARIPGEQIFLKSPDQLLTGGC